MLEEATKELDESLKGVEDAISRAKVELANAQGRVQRTELEIKQLHEKRDQIRKALEVLRAVDGPAQITP